MATETEGSTLERVTDLGGSEESGDGIRKRRERLGLSRTRLAEMAHVDRDTLTKLEEGLTKARGTTVAAILRVLDELEEETGMADPHPNNGGGVVRFEVKGVYGAESLVIEGPVENIAELQEAVDRLLRRRETDPEG